MASLQVLWQIAQTRYKPGGTWFPCKRAQSLGPYPRHFPPTREIFWQRKAPWVRRRENFEGKTRRRTVGFQPVTAAPNQNESVTGSNISARQALVQSKITQLGEWPIILDSYFSIFQIVSLTKEQDEKGVQFVWVISAYNAIQSEWKEKVLVRIDEFCMVLGSQPMPFCFYPLSRVTRKSAPTASNTTHETDFPSNPLDVFRTISLSLTNCREKWHFANSVVKKKKHGVCWPPETMRNSSIAWLLCMSVSPTHILKWEELAWVRHSSTWEELDKFKRIEAKCREKPWKSPVDGDLAESIKRSASDRLGDLVP